MINIFTAGQHGHEMPKEADQLIQNLLNKANIDCRDKVWECRIDRQEHASTISPPIRVINFKPYGIVLKVKSQPTDTRCQIMTLQLPQGIEETAESIFNKLKEAEKSVSRSWRKDVDSPPLVNLPDTKVLDTKVQFENLAAIYKHEDKLIAVLSKVDELSKRPQINTREMFVNVLREELGWMKFLLRICSRALNELVSQNYIMEVVSVDGRRIKGFTLTDKGTHVLLKIPIPEPAKIVKSDFLINSHNVLMELAKISETYNNNLKKKEELLLEIGRIDAENQEIDSKSQALMKKLNGTK